MQEATASNLRTEKQASPLEGFNAAEDGVRQNADLVVDGAEDIGL